ncbi:hypothetical protein AOQ84DRAFT_388034 [Glonium stellatum]|uniref:Uncharacterized protein n=1 Tax=Glonium stellatum TaxID=574774 RepID=A0A8E2F333_9PEZI|nr:hypothetical protein AOQ84DRAFT_388034 [Glonium stellatum]
MYISNDESDGGGITLPPTTRLGTNANLFSNALPSTGVVSGQTAYTNISGNGFQSTFPSSREASLQPSHSSRAGGELSYQSNSAPGGGSSHAPEALIAHYRYNELPIDGMISTPSSHLSTTSINPQGNPQFPSIQNWPPPIPSAAPQPMNCNGTLQSNHALFSSDYLSNTGSAVNSLQPCSNPQDMLHSRPQAVETSLLYGYNHLDNIGVFRGRGGDDDMSDADIVDNQAESGPGELPRGVFSPSRSGVIAVDRPIPADRPESKRVLKAKRKLARTQRRAELSRELQQAAKAEREDETDPAVKAITTALQNTILSSADKPKNRKKNKKACKACKIRHYHDQALCDPAQLMQLLEKAEQDAKKELRYAEDPESYETQETLRLTRMQKRVMHRRQKKDAGLNSKNDPSRSQLSPRVLSVESLQKIGECYVHIALLRGRTLAETQEQRMKTAKDIDKLFEAIANARNNKNETSNRMQKQCTKQKASSGRYSTGKFQEYTGDHLTTARGHTDTIAFPPHQAVPSNLDDINAIRARIRGSPGYQSFGLLYTQYVNDADTLPHTSASGSSSVAGLHTSRLLAVQTPENNRTSQNNVTLAALENRRASSTTTLDGPQMGRRQGQDNGIRQTQAPQEEFNFGDSNQELPWRFQDLRLD